MNEILGKQIATLQSIFLHVVDERVKKAYYRRNLIVGRKNDKTNGSKPHEDF